MQAGAGRSRQEQAPSLRPVSGRGLCLSPPSSAGCSLLTLAVWFQLTAVFLPPQDPYSGSRLHFAAFLAQTRAHLSCAPSSPIPVLSLLFSIAPLQSALCWLSFTLLYIISCPTTQETTIPHFQNPPP